MYARIKLDIDARSHLVLLFGNTCEFQYLTEENIEEAQSYSRSLSFLSPYIKTILASVSDVSSHTRQDVHLQTAYFYSYPNAKFLRRLLIC